MNLIINVEKPSGVFFFILMLRSIVSDQFSLFPRQVCHLNCSVSLSASTQAPGGSRDPEADPGHTRRLQRSDQAWREMMVLAGDS